MKLGLRSAPRARSATSVVRSSGAEIPRYDFSAGAAMRVRKHVVGHEGNPVLVVDGLLANPASVREFAAAEVRYIEGPESTYYPGTRGRGSDDYVATFTRQLGPAMRETFGLRDDVRLNFDNMFSLTTTPPESLRPLQKVPHVDIVGPRLIAVVHLLFDRPLGGTGFFRHKATGWESITDERSQRFDRMVLDELDESGAPGGYLFAENSYFERTFNVEPALDRLVIFSGHMLHSATVPAGAELVDDPMRGRLTINSFISLS